jgi:uncharacterized membrane protein YkoI
MRIFTTIFIVASLSFVMVITGIFTLTEIQRTNAQQTTTSGQNQSMTGGGMMNMMMGNASNITGSLKLSTIFGNALASQIKMSLSQAATTAQNAVGNGSHSLEAHIGVENGYLVYTVWVVDGNYNFHRVVVDAGNGKILSSQQISKEGAMMIHGMMMHQMMMSSMMSGPPRAGMMQHGPGGGMYGGSTTHSPMAGEHKTW